MPDPSQDKSNYNDEMRRWMAKQSFWHRLKYGRQPGSRAKLYAFVAKVVLGFVVFIGLGVGGYLMAVKKRVGSAEFAKDLSIAASESLGARAINGSPVVWSGGVARVRNLSINGGRSNFFSKIDLELVAFPLKFSEVMRGDLKISSIEGRGADAKLRSGAFTDREWQELLSSDDVKQEQGVDGWMSPSVDLSSVNHVGIRDLNAQWGAKAWMAGSLIGCDLEATKSNGKWNVQIEHGKFSQNWIKNAEIEKLVLEVDLSGIRVLEGKLRMPSGTAVSVSGTISSDDDPEFDLAVRIDEFLFSDFIAEEKAIFLSGTFGADVQITGSVNRKEGLISKGRLVAEPASEAAEGSAIRNRPWLVKIGRNIDAELPVFRAFGEALGEDGVRYFTSERTVIDFETSMGNLEVTEMTLYDPLVGQLSGAFSFNEKSKLITGGSMTLALKDSVFENNRGLREIRSKLFTEGENGASQFSIELKGPIDGLTESAAQRVLEVAEIDG